MNIFEVPVFTGVESDLQPWIKWMEDYFTRDGDFIEAQKLEMAGGFIAGDVEAWFMDSEPFDTWASFKTGLLLFFGNVSVSKRQPATTMTHHVEEIKQVLPELNQSPPGNMDLVPVGEEILETTHNGEEKLLSVVVNFNEQHSAHQLFRKMLGRRNKDFKWFKKKKMKKEEVTRSKTTELKKYDPALVSMIEVLQGRTSQIAKESQRMEPLVHSSKTVVAETALLSLVGYGNVPIQQSLPTKNLVADVVVIRAEGLKAPIFGDNKTEEPLKNNLSTVSDIKQALPELKLCTENNSVSWRELQEVVATLSALPKSSQIEDASGMEKSVVLSDFENIGRNQSAPQVLDISSVRRNLTSKWLKKIGVKIEKRHRNRQPHAGDKKKYEKWFSWKRRRKLKSLRREESRNTVRKVVLDDSSEEDSEAPKATSELILIGKQLKTSFVLQVAIVLHDSIHKFLVVLLDKEMRSLFTKSWRFKYKDQCGIANDMLATIISVVLEKEKDLLQAHDARSDEIKHFPSLLGKCENGTTTLEAEVVKWKNNIDPLTSEKRDIAEEGYHLLRTYGFDSSRLDNASSDLEHVLNITHAPSEILESSQYVLKSDLEEDTRKLVLQPKIKHQGRISLSKELEMKLKTADDNFYEEADVLFRVLSNISRWEHTLNSMEELHFAIDWVEATATPKNLEPDDVARLGRSLQSTYTWESIDLKVSVQQENFGIHFADSRNQTTENALQWKHEAYLRQLCTKKCTKTWKFKFKNGGLEREWLGHLKAVVRMVKRKEKKTRPEMGSWFIMGLKQEEGNTKNMLFRNTSFELIDKNVLENVCALEFLQENLHQQLTSQYISIYTITTLLPIRDEQSFYTSKKIPFTNVLGGSRKMDTGSKVLCFMLQCCEVVAKLELAIKEISTLFSSNSQLILGAVNASDLWLELLVMGKGTHSSKKRRRKDQQLHYNFASMHGYDVKIIGVLAMQAGGDVLSLILTLTGVGYYGRSIHILKVHKEKRSAVSKSWMFKYKDNSEQELNDDSDRIADLRDYGKDHVMFFLSRLFHWWIKRASLRNTKERTPRQLHTGAMNVSQPTSFKQKPDLSTSRDQFFFMEYWEEKLLMLNNEGMDAKFFTYSQLSSPEDHLGNLLCNPIDGQGNVMVVHRLRVKTVASCSSTVSIQVHANQYETLLYAPSLLEKVSGLIREASESANKWLCSECQEKYLVHGRREQVLIALFESGLQMKHLDIVQISTVKVLLYGDNLVFKSKLLRLLEKKIHHFVCFIHKFIVNKHDRKELLMRETLHRCLPWQKIKCKHNDEQEPIQSFLVYHQRKKLDINLRGLLIGLDLMKGVVKQFYPELQDLNKKVHGVATIPITLGALAQMYIDNTVMMIFEDSEMVRGLNLRVTQVTAYPFTIPLSSLSVLEANSVMVPYMSPSVASVNSYRYGVAVLDDCEQIIARVELVASTHNFNTFVELGKALRYYTVGAAFVDVNKDTLTGNFQRTVDIMWALGFSLHMVIDLAKQGAVTEGVGWVALENPKLAVVHQWKEKHIKDWMFKFKMFPKIVARIKNSEEKQGSYIGAWGQALLKRGEY